MKKFAILLIVFLIVNNGTCQIKYVTTLHPFKNILTSVVGDRGEVYEILPPGASPHTYQLIPSDMRAVETATAFFLGGHNLDEWALKFQNPYRIELLDLIPEKYLRHFDGEEKSAASVESNAQNLHQHAHDSGVDPHFWTDPLAVKSLLPSLTDTLCAIDPIGKEIYMTNARRFASQLDSLNSKISKYLAHVQGKPVILSHPFFRYFFDRYKISLAWIIESSPRKELTPKKLKEIIQKVKTEKIKAIFVHPQLPDRSARVIAEAAGIKIYILDPIGGVAGRQTYNELLLYNTQVLLEALK